MNQPPSHKKTRYAPDDHHCLQLSKEEKKLVSELNNLQESENAMDCDIKEAGKKKEKLIKEEERHWKEYSKYRRDCILIEDKQKR